MTVGSKKLRESYAGYSAIYSGSVFPTVDINITAQKQDRLDDALKLSWEKTKVKNIIGRLFNQQKHNICKPPHLSKKSIHRMRKKPVFLHAIVCKKKKT